MGSSQLLTDHANHAHLRATMPRLWQRNRVIAGTHLASSHPIAGLIYNLTVKRILGAFPLYMVILLAAGIANAQDKTIKRVPAKPTTSISGKSLFHEYCAVCHGDDGKGAGPAASALKQPPGDLTWFARNNSGKFPEERFLRIINGSEAVTAHGTQDMPIWGTIFSNSGNLSLTQLRVHALLEFVEQMQAE